MYWIWYVLPIILVYIRQIYTSNFELLTGFYNWNNGKQECLNRGMQYVMIKDEAKMIEVETYMLGLSTPSNTWMGLYWEPIPYELYWVDGSLLGGYSKWDNDGQEPDCMEGSQDKKVQICSAYDENCVRLWLSGGQLYWKTRRCSSSYRVLCETPTTEPPTTPNVRSTLSLETTMDEESTTKFLFKSTTGDFVTLLLNESMSTFSLETEASTFVCHNTVTLNSNCVCTGDYNSTYIYDAYLYRVPWKTTKSYYRSLNSAYDNRLSAKVMGVSGGIIIAAMFLCVVVLDMTHLNSRLRKIEKRGRRRKTKIKPKQDPDLSLEDMS